MWLTLCIFLFLVITAHTGLAGIFTTEWRFHPNNGSCNTYDDMHYSNTVTVKVVPGATPLVIPSICRFKVKLLNEFSLGAYMQFDGAIACGNTVEVVGYCGSITCDKYLLSCKSELPYSVEWDRVTLLMLAYTVKNDSWLDGFSISISNIYDDSASTTERSFLGKIAKWAVALIIIGVITVVLCIVGVPLCICCGFFKRRSSRAEQPPVRYINPAPAGMYYGQPAVRY